MGTDDAASVQIFETFHTQDARREGVENDPPTFLVDEFRRHWTAQTGPALRRFSELLPERWSANC